MKIDQIAFYAHNSEQARAIKKHLGLLHRVWVVDEVVGAVSLGGISGPNTLGAQSSLSGALLEFNYDLGIEVEILTYKDASNWHALYTPEYEQGKTFMSHIGIHLGDGEDFREVDAPLVQEMITKSHTNEYLIKKGRTYHYKIYDTRNLLGCYTKYIKRIEQ